MMATIYNFDVKKPNGDMQSLEDYKGEVFLVVNTASKCGFTPQFKELQSLYTKFKDQGFAVLGFPCDQFANQEFENQDEIMEFCQLNYGVNFPMYAKVNVKGEQADPLFKYITSEKKGLLNEEVKWNFTKFLVDRKGNVVKRFAPQTSPSKMEGNIVKLLAEKS
jgi:glutathione peroxidase